MRALTLSAVLLLAACSQPEQKSAIAPEAEADVAWNLFLSNDPMIVAPKCMALLKRPEIASEPEAAATYTAWRTWYEKTETPPALMSQMVTLNEGAYAATPEKSVRAGLGFCSRKISEIAPDLVKPGPA